MIVECCVLGKWQNLMHAPLQGHVQVPNLFLPTLTTEDYTAGKTKGPIIKIKIFEMRPEEYSEVCL